MADGKKPPAGIRVDDAADAALTFLMASEGRDGPYRVLRQLLEQEAMRTRKRGTSVAGALQPLAEKLQAVQREIDALVDASRQADLWSWTSAVQSHPPSPAAIALLLVQAERRVRAAGTEAVQAKERARTEAARQSIAAKGRRGDTKGARAMEMLRAIEKRGDSIMDRSVTARVASALGCTQTTVASARKQLLSKRK